VGCDVVACLLHVGRCDGCRQVGQKLVERTHGDQADAADQIEHPTQMINGDGSGQGGGPQRRQRT
jgi:hypothetical protein